MDSLDDFKTLLAFPSISSEPENRKAMLECYAWVKSQVEQAGFSTETWQPREGYPILFASWTKAPGKPTVLLYNHYDVQPVDPLELWTTPPFHPAVRENTVWARGAQDNKGQLFYTLQALKKIWEKDKAFPLNIKWIIEGEEEIGSPSLPEVLEANKSKLKADFLAIIDGGIPSAETPAVSLGMRGLVTIDVKAVGTSQDLHSGIHGGIAYNPIYALAAVLSSAKNDEGTITIPGFYDAITPLTDKEKADIDFSFDEEGYKRDFGAPPTGGEVRYSLAERNWLRPTFEINGFSGGYTGNGFKTVIPAEAHAKISCRLARGQDPKVIGQLVCRWLESQAPSGISITASVHAGGGTATLTSPHTPIVEAFSKAFSDIYGKPCLKVLEGASIPIVAALEKASGASSLLVGMGLATDRIHAPDEHFSLDRLKKGEALITKALFNLSVPKS